jgi:hypothetical protein
MTETGSPRDALDAWSDGLEGCGDPLDPANAQGRKIRWSNLEELRKEVALVDADHLQRLENAVLQKIVPLAQDHSRNEAVPTTSFCRIRNALAAHRSLILGFTTGATASFVLCAIGIFVWPSIYGTGSLRNLTQVAVPNSANSPEPSKSAESVMSNTLTDAGKRTFGAHGPISYTAQAGDSTALVQELVAILIAEGITFQFDHSDAEPQITVLLPKTIPARTSAWLSSHQITDVGNGEVVIIFAH